MISFFAVLSTNYLLRKLDTLLIHKTTEQQEHIVQYTYIRNGFLKTYLLRLPTH